MHSLFPPPFKTYSSTISLTRIRKRRKKSFETPFYPQKKEFRALIKWPISFAMPAKRKKSPQNGESRFHIYFFSLRSCKLNLCFLKKKKLKKFFNDKFDSFLFLFPFLVFLSLASSLSRSALLHWEIHLVLINLFLSVF